MELNKRKRADDGETNGNKMRGKEEEDSNGVINDDPPPRDVPCDEEVEEFFAILKRVQVAVKYFQERRNGINNGRELPASSWSLSVSTEGFDGGVLRKVDSEEKSKESERAGLDLNSDPVSDEPESSV